MKPPTFACFECGLTYYKPWWQPRLVAERQWLHDHMAWHQPMLDRSIDD